MRPTYRRSCIAALCVLPLLLAVPVSRGGEFSVNPIRLELGAAAKSGAISVRNEGTQSLNFQLQAFEWTQDGDGKDQYTETRDLIFFPKIMTIAPTEEGVVRVGARAPVVVTEKTYRLFIEELPSPAPGPTEIGTARINVLVRFGAPVFVVPQKSQDGAEIPAMALARGTLNLSIRNTGNRHQLVEYIKLTGSDPQNKEVFGLTLADRYLLAGATKSYTADIPADQCEKIANLTAELKTDKGAAERKVNVVRAMCR